MTERETLCSGPAPATVMAVIDSLYISPDSQPRKGFLNFNFLAAFAVFQESSLFGPSAINFSFEKVEKIRVSPFNYARLGVSAFKVNIQS